MFTDTIEAIIIGSNNEVIKVVKKKKSNAEFISSTLKLVQTEINEFLTALVNENDNKEIEEIGENESNYDESEDDTTEKQEEIKISSIKRGEQNIKPNKKIKKT